MGATRVALCTTIEDVRSGIRSLMQGVKNESLLLPDQPPMIVCEQFLSAAGIRGPLAWHCDVWRHMHPEQVNNGTLWAGCLPTPGTECTHTNKPWHVMDSPNTAVTLQETK